MKDEMRIVKDGKTKGGKQIYVLVYNNKRIRFSTDMVKLEAIQKEIEMSKKYPAGRNIYFGVREHGMAAILNGIALNGLKVSTTSTKSLA